ncbi:MAG: (2Fe-2S)-binding protein [Planctomycetota bacterium]
MSETSVLIRVDGQELRVRRGISLAAALFEAGAPATRRALDGSPRAALCGMGICFECRVLVADRTERRACRIPCEEGLEVRTR